MLQKSIESIVDGEQDKHVDHREHQTGVDTMALESRVAKAALSYFGHVVRAGGMEDDVNSAE